MIMITFDDLLPVTQSVLDHRRDAFADLEWLVLNVDLYGRLRLIAPQSASQQARDRLAQLYQELATQLGAHAYPLASGVLFEPELAAICERASCYALDAPPRVWVADRLATQSYWDRIEKVAAGVPRMVFYSIKGGVGRSTALAACAWSLAQAGRKVMVIDLDLESPGLTRTLISEDKQPKFGVTDWLVEDLVDQADRLLDDVYARSDLLTQGDIIVVPAHGREPGDYISKLGRVWMSKNTGARVEDWSQRLDRLLHALEDQHKPDVILIDARAGIDDVAATCITDLGAHTILLFAVQGEQTWSGYRVLFDHWHKRKKVLAIRERLQLVAGMVPEDDTRLDYLRLMREQAYDLFQSLYDEIRPGEEETQAWSYALEDDYAPHAPLPVSWNRAWYGLMNLHGVLPIIEPLRLAAVYGPLTDFLERALQHE